MIYILSRINEIHIIKDFKEKINFSSKNILICFFLMLTDLLLHKATQRILILHVEDHSINRKQPVNLNLTSYRLFKIPPPTSCHLTHAFQQIVFYQEAFIWSGQYYSKLTNYNTLLKIIKQILKEIKTISFNLLHRLIRYDVRFTVRSQVVSQFLFRLYQNHD